MIAHDCETGRERGKHRRSRADRRHEGTPYGAAFVRALVTGLLTAATTFLATWSTTNNAKTLGIATATTFLAPFLARFGGEGAYDTHRAAFGNIKRGDIGQ